MLHLQLAVLTLALYLITLERATALSFKAMQQAYAACVPAPPAAVPPAGLKLAVALLLLAIPIGLGVAWRERHGGDGWLAGTFAAIAWILGLPVLALTAVGVRFLFS